MSSTHGNLKHTIKPYILYNQMSPNCTYSNMSISSSSPSPTSFIPRDTNSTEGVDTPEKDVKLLGHLGHLGHLNYPYWGRYGYGYGHGGYYGGYYGMPYYGCSPYRNCWRWPGYY